MRERTVNDMADKIRVTQHNARKGRADHNDRTWYDDHPDSGRHINKDMSDNNLLWDWTEELTEDEIDALGDIGDDLKSKEMAYYQMAFGDALRLQNAKYDTHGNTDRIRTMQDWYESHAKRPEESIIQIGNMHDRIDVDVLTDVYDDFHDRRAEWLNAHGNPYKLLSSVLHADEASTHIHERKVWQYQDKDGILCIGQERALEQAGIPLPDPNKPRSRYNNRKMTYDSIMRNMLLDICEEHGISINREPIPDQRSKELTDYIREQEEERLKEREILKGRKQGLDRREKQINEREHAVKRSEDQIRTKQELIRDRDSKSIKRLNEANNIFTTADKTLAMADKLYDDAGSLSNISKEWMNTPAKINGILIKPIEMYGKWAKWKQKPIREQRQKIVDIQSSDIGRKLESQYSEIMENDRRRRQMQNQMEI